MLRATSPATTARGTRRATLPLPALAPTPCCTGSLLSALRRNPPP